MKEAQKQVSILFSLIVFVAIALGLLYYFSLLEPLFVLLLILAVLVVVYTQTGTFFIQLSAYERAVVFRRGEYRGVVGPGWVFLIPFLENYTLIDLRTQTIDIKEQEVVTNDNIKIKADAILFLKVTDPKAAILNVEDYKLAATSSIQAGLRAVIGQMQLSDVISNINKINHLLIKNSEAVAKEWGISIEKVEIQAITLPESLQKAMHQLKEAQQKKLASREIAEGTKIRIDAIQDAAGKLTDPALHYLYLQSLQKIAEGKSNKIIFPLELSNLASALSSRIGNFAGAQDQVLKEYKQKTASGENKKSILKELQEEVGAEPEKEVKKHAKKKKDDFDF